LVSQPFFIKGVLQFKNNVNNIYIITNSISKEIHDIDNHKSLYKLFRNAGINVKDSEVGKYAPTAVSFPHQIRPLPLWLHVRRQKELSKQDEQGQNVNKIRRGDSVTVPLTLVGMSQQVCCLTHHGHKLN
jgi:hypothetical protein